MAIPTTEQSRPDTVGALRASGYTPRPLRDEMRSNLVARMRQGGPLFPGIEGYDDTVIPALQNAILAGQDMILLGERGQAKSRIIRALATLLDAETPVLDGPEIPENPFDPISEQGRQLIAEQGDAAPVRWVGADERYGEKLATPDITIADLIGEVDPIKVAEGRYLSDELTIHYGLVPRTNRGIFCINELPDLAERIQVGLLNIMEERDVQIRGFRVRLPLDILIVASANPEDYTNRGRIITPLKDRYGAQIRTHYPESVETEMAIMRQEAAPLEIEGLRVDVPGYMEEVVAEVTRLARRSPDVSQRSGVSVRASIAGLETLLANAARRALTLGETHVVPRVSDLPHIVPAIQGKMEMETVEDGKDEQILEKMLQGGVATVFNRRFNVVDLEEVVNVFKEGVSVEVGESVASVDYPALLTQVEGLREALEPLQVGEDAADVAAAVEFLLEGLHLNKRLNKDQVGARIQYRG
ncbi:MAG: magnesium chelatase subunit I [Chloroflexi bacterium]|nr:MAG: magnesium chelatase subunit I [Chloroflexota bacterium]